MLNLNTIEVTDCLSGLKRLPDDCVDSCVTSPPYFALRDYGVAGQMGQEESPELYVDGLVRVFDEVRRVLKPTGNLWLNLGDTYAGTRSYQVASTIGANSGRANMGSGRGMNAAQMGLKPKDLIGVPWMVAFALRSSGWFLRQDIIWHKPNCMPESVTDRCTKSHEYIFLLTKSPRYYFNAEAIKTPAKESSLKRYAQNIAQQNGSHRVPGKTNGPMKAVPPGQGRHPRPGIDINGGNQASSTGIPVFSKSAASGLPVFSDPTYSAGYNGIKANKRSVWSVSPKPFKEAHFATYPPELITDCIRAGCPPGGVVLDPFMGAGTTALVAATLGRHFLGFELNEEYARIARRRLQDSLGMFY